MLVTQWKLMLVTQWKLMLVTQWKLLLVTQWKLMLVTQWKLLLVTQWKLMLVTQWKLMLVTWWSPDILLWSVRNSAWHLLIDAMELTCGDLERVRLESHQAGLWKSTSLMGGELRQKPIWSRPCTCCFQPQKRLNRCMLTFLDWILYAALM